MCSVQQGETYSFRSLDVREAFDCQAGTEAFFEFWYYAEAGGRGKVVHQHSARGRGHSRGEDTISKSLLAAACKAHEDRSQISMATPLRAPRPI
ncbi:MAG: surface-adhesin E family protein [Burkholderiales bacterium]